MKKNGKTKKKKVVYEESPWGDDDPIIGEFVTDLLPPASVLKRAKVRTFNSDEMPLPLREDDAKILRKQARKAGLTPRALITAIVHDYLHGRPGRV